MLGGFLSCPNNFRALFGQETTIRADSSLFRQDEAFWAKPLLPGTPVIKDGYVAPSDAPGFGMEFDLDWLEERTV